MWWGFQKCDYLPDKKRRCMDTPLVLCPSSLFLPGTWTYKPQEPLGKLEDKSHLLRREDWKWNTNGITEYDSLIAGLTMWLKINPLRWSLCHLNFLLHAAQCNPQSARGTTCMYAGLTQWDISLDGWWSSWPATWGWSWCRGKPCWEMDRVLQPLEPSVKLCLKVDSPGESATVGPLA